MAIAPYSTWRSVFEADELSALLAICVAARPIIVEALNGSRPGGFPSGRPAKEIARAAGWRLLQLAEGDDSPRSLSRRALAWMVTTEQPLREDGEMDLAVTHAQMAVELAQQAHDPLITALAFQRLGAAYGSAQQPKMAIDADLAVLRELDGLDPFSAAHWLHDEIPFLASAVEPGLGYSLEYRTLMHLSSKYREVGDPLTAIDYANKAAATARQGKGMGSSKVAYPAKYAWALVRRGEAERLLCDTEAFLRTENELEQLASSEGNINGPVHRYWWLIAGDNAFKLHDCGVLERVSRRRLVARAMDNLGVDISDDDISVTTVRNLIDHARQRDSKKVLTGIGNIVYEIVRARQYGGLFDDDPAARREGLALLEAVEEAWKGYAVNGAQAVKMARARIRLLDDDAPVGNVTSALLEVHAQAIRRQTGLNALILAVRGGAVGSTEVFRRLIESLATVDTERSVGENAVLHGLLAEWWYRVNSEEGDNGHPVDWQSGESAALDAARMLRPAGVSLDPELEAIVWHAASAAVTARRGSPAEALERLLHAVRAIAELMVTVATTADRLRHARRFAQTFTTAADLAVQLGDHRAADIIFESARRDRIGLILAELARNPDVDSDIRALALKAKQYGSTTPTAAVAEGSSSFDEEGDADGEDDSRVRRRSVAILDDRRYAVAQIEHVLGPLGRLCDAQGLETISAAAILRERPQTDRLTVVLQLMSSTVTPMNLDRNVGAVKVYRRLTWQVSPDEPIQEYYDSTEMPEHMMKVSAEQAISWAPYYSEYLLPETLFQIVNAADNLIRLLVVPTGFFHVPFDALPVNEHQLLIDIADVTVHGSLTSTLALMGINSAAAKAAPVVAVFDTRPEKQGGVTYAADELQVLTEHLEVRSAHTAADLSAHLTIHDDIDASISALAMAVHGVDDDYGWGQAKILPDGNIVTAAEALHWDVPKLCVLASCHSAITAPDGIELGGFPLALMLRGAVTVIGGLYDIYDQPTTEIMKGFWPIVARDKRPLEALYAAKRNWLAADPNRRLQPWLWAGLITYGAPSE